jgi:hypothetical protein
VSAERDDLAEVIGEALGAEAGIHDTSWHEDCAIADNILDAGYRKPRTITTVEELDALPFGSVVLDRSGLSLHKSEFTGWRASNGAKDISEEMLEQEAFPASVLHEGRAS